MAGYKSLYGGTLMYDFRGWLGHFHDVLRLRILLMAFVFIACGNASAQTTGTLLGIVSDQNGAVVPSATVKAQNTDTGFTVAVKASAEGSYLIPLLPLGHYSISVEVSGFKTFTRSGVLVPVGQDIRVDVKMEVGEVSQTVNVVIDTVNIETANATLGATVDKASLNGLPLDGRNAMGLMQTLPGVATSTAPTAVTGARSGPTFSISGSRTNTGAMMLDGTIFTDALANTGQQFPSVDALEEFRVLADNYSAEYGRAAGSVVVAVTKSGTNQFHGSAWEYIRNNAFDSTNHFTPKGQGTPFLRQHQYGGDFGGPVILPKYNGHNRTFFFVAYEHLQIHQEGIQVSHPLTAAQRTGDFSSSLSSQVITDPATGLPYPGNIIPGSQIDNFAKNTIGLYMPLPNQPDGVTLSLLEPNPIDGNQVTVKVDQTLGEKDRLWFRFYWNKYTDASYNQFPAFHSTQGEVFKSYAAAETHTFTPNLINEFEMSYSRPEGLPSIFPPTETAIALGMNAKQVAPYPQTPNVTVNGAFGFGTGWYVDEPSSFVQGDEKLSWIHGKHSLRVGMMYMHERNGDLAYPAWPNVTYSGTYTGNPSADYLIGRPSNINGLSTIHDNGWSDLYQPYAQDDFKVAKNLTLTLGLRYDLQTPWTERHGIASTYIAGLQSTVYPTAPPGLVVPGDKGVHPGFYALFKTPFAPRLGIAWDPTGTGQTSIRAAWGIYHGVVNQEVEAVETNNAPFLVSFNNTPASAANPWAGTVDPMPYDPKTPKFFFPTEETSVNPKFRQPDTQQFNLNVQRRFWNNLFVQVAYVGGISHHLYDARELNAAVFGPGATEANAQSRRPTLPQYYSDIPGLFSDANSNYHSLQAQVQKTFSNHYTVQGAYTWGRSIDNRSATTIDNNSESAQDPNHWFCRCERAASDFNVTHILSLNGLWDLPALSGRGFLTGIAGGWRIAGIFRYNTGQPLNIIVGQDIPLIGGSRTNGNSERPNLVGNPTLSKSRSRQAQANEYFNTAAFATPASGTFGTVARNSVVGPGVLTNDISLNKSFPLFGDKGKLGFRADLFNLLNWTNLNAPNNTLVSGQFGQIQSAGNGGDQRIAQFALRYDF
jgi:hypothetical protein